MAIGLIFKGLLTGFLVSLPMGPLAVLVIQRTANRNFKSGFITGLGVATTDSIWAILAGFSISFIITFLQQHQSIIQIIGALLLTVLGLKIFLSHPINSLKKFRRKGSTPIQDYFTGMGVAFSNPLNVLAYIAIFASAKIVFNIQFISEPFLFIIGFFVGASTWWLTITSLINRFRHKFNLRVLWWFNKISGGLIILFVVITTAYVLINGNPKF
jgi:threonine/homoserine/homoserine lactone efflux protein